MNIIAHTRQWFMFSGALIVISVIAIAFWGVKFGIDFTGGSLLEVVVDNRPAATEIATFIRTNGFESVTVQLTGENALLVRSKTLSQSEHQSLLSLLNQEYGNVKELRFDSIGPVIGNELRRNSILAVIVTLVCIGAYIAWAFRKVSKPIASWKYGALTILAAFHDVFITVGAFAILGHFFNWEIGASFVAAVLTILGYSINDTVVVFDRTRENLKNNPHELFGNIVEQSIQQTFTRSINTSFTTLLALLAIFLLGGETTRSFAFALIVGIGVGTYSSIFIASPLLVAWNNLKMKSA